MPRILNLIADWWPLLFFIALALLSALSMHSLIFPRKNGQG
jgi:hypothetical protein